MTVKASDLAAANKAIGEIMSAMAARRLLARGVTNSVIRAKIAERALDDAAIEEIAVRAFEVSCMALAEANYPGVTVFSCNPTAFRHESDPQPSQEKRRR